MSVGGIDIKGEHILPLWDKKARKSIPAINIKGGMVVYDAAHYLQNQLNRDIGRATVYRYAQKGLPLWRSGPKLLLPVVYVGGNTSTSVEAIDRFLKKITKEMENQSND